MSRLIDAEDAINQVAMIAKALAKSDKQKALCGRIIFMVEHRPTVKAIPKADYENRLKADMVAILEEISLEIDEMDCTIDHDFEGYYTGHVDCQKLIREKINKLKEVEQ